MLTLPPKNNIIIVEIDFFKRDNGMLKKIIKKLNALFLAICIFAISYGFPAKAIEYPVYAIVGNDAMGYHNVDVYSKAGSTGHEAAGEKKGSSRFITTLEKGEVVKVFGAQTDADGDLWYKIGYGKDYKSEGYAYEVKLTLTAEYKEDIEFEKWLTAQKFPESYKEGLRQLHELYPQWVFYADHTNLEWEDVIAAESAVGYKLVAATSPISWKSMEDGAYDWENQRWYGFDGDYWVAASKTVVEYFIDPRNFFDTNSIFMFSSQSYDKKYDTPENLKKMISGTFLNAKLPDNNSKTYSDAIMQAAKVSKLSPLVIASNILQEQGANGSGGSISGKIKGYEGIYNFFNIGAYAAGGMNAIERGLWWAKGPNNNTSYGRPWINREKSITGGSQWYAESFVSKGQNTYYYMNFNVSPNAYYNKFTHQYATNIQDTVSKAFYLAKAYTEVRDSSLVFNIPVYKNMPERTNLPESGDNNNFLKSLAVEGIKDNSLQSFDKYVFSYELIVPNDQESVKITAEPVSQSAVVSGIGEVKLKIGDNIIDVVVKASSGEERTYKITIHRSALEPTISDAYKFNEKVTGIAPETTVSSFKKKLKVKNGTVKIFDSNENEKTSGYIATGDIIKIYGNDSKLNKSGTAVILGDSNGDGKISSIDLLVGQRHILQITALNDVNFLAMDIDKDGKVKSKDLLMGQRHILKIATIME